MLHCYFVTILQRCIATLQHCHCILDNCSTFPTGARQIALGRCKNLCFCLGSGRVLPETLKSPARQTAAVIGARVLFLCCFCDTLVRSELGGLKSAILSITFFSHFQKCDTVVLESGRVLTIFHNCDTVVLDSHQDFPIFFHFSRIAILWCWNDPRFPPFGKFRTLGGLGGLESLGSLGGLGGLGGLSGRGKRRGSGDSGAAG